MITLKDFVRDSLAQIADAAKEFGDSREDEASPYPSVRGAVDEKMWSNHGLLFLGFGDEVGARYASIVDFDVAVTAQDTDSTQAGGGIRVVSVFSAGGEMQTQSTNASVSRIRFKLPLQIR